MRRGSSNVSASTRSATGRRRFQQVLVLPRMFPAPATADLPGALMAARGLFEFPALLLVLERGGMLTPTLAVQAVRQAVLVQRIGDRDRRTVALVLLQGAVALVDRLRMTGVVRRRRGHRSCRR